MQKSREVVDIAACGEAIPAPPAGYDNPLRFQYPVLLLNLISFAFLILAVPAVGLFMMWIHGTGDSFIIRFGVIDLITFGIIVFVTVVSHELIHAQTARQLGFQITFGMKWRLLVPYVAVYHQFMTRKHNILIAAAPLLVLTAVFIPLLFIPIPLILVIASTGLVANTAGSVGDLYLIWRLLRFPPQTLLYDVSMDCMLIFPPTTSTATTYCANRAESPE